MGLDRSAITKPNVQANLNASKSKDTFVKVDENSTLRVRFLPTTHPEGLLTYTTTSHFKLKEEADDGGVKGMALACLNEHGEGEAACYICDLIKALNKTGDKGMAKIAKQLRGSTRYNYQVLVAEKQPNGEWSYGKPKILGLPKTASDDLAQLLANMELMGQPDFADVEKGQDILISRSGTGINTKYRIDRTGVQVNLDEVYPGWDKDFIEDMWDALGLRTFSREQMKQAARFTYSEEIDWEMMADEFGL